MLDNKWNAAYEKLEILCENNGLEFSVKKERFPMMFTITPSLENTMQMSLEGDSAAKKNEISMQFVFDEELTVRFFGDFAIDDETLNKLKTQAKKLHYIWLQIWFSRKDERWNRYRYPECFRDHESAITPDSNGYINVYVPHWYRP
ncbi:MAG: hypothetical protein FWB96_01410 [Defluviitaleaceae bacterium]|nr:hypothetical protein [Defluviitaleaceae bacterium]MCL2261649.1 hypothetical protein [Defluviitaleaceae bacterium]